MGSTGVRELFGRKFTRLAVITGILLSVSLLVVASALAGGRPDSRGRTHMNAGSEYAMFGAGCFWGVEETFRKVPGVIDTAVGYAGGSTANPTYKEVCSDRTGHAEVVRVEFDPQLVSYQDLLNLFFQSHDPTTLNRQGPDFGSQYRSVIFCYSPAQRQMAEATRQALEQSGKFKRPIVTAIEPAPEFYRAEDYHQRYLEKRGLGVCH